MVDRSATGREAKPAVNEVEKGAIRRFAELRKHLYAQIQRAKQGWRPSGEKVAGRANREI